MREPQKAERVTGTDSRAFSLYTYHISDLTYMNHPVRESAEGQSWPDMLHPLIM